MSRGLNYSLSGNSNMFRRPSAPRMCLERRYVSRLATGAAARLIQDMLFMRRHARAVAGTVRRPLVPSSRLSIFLVGAAAAVVMVNLLLVLQADPGKCS